jgi:hypothetical protein
MTSGIKKKLDICGCGGIDGREMVEAKVYLPVLIIILQIYERLLYIQYTCTISSKIILYLGGITDISDCYII